MIQADRAGGMRDHLAWSGNGFKVLVRDKDAATARAALHPPQVVPQGKLAVAQVCGTRYDAEITHGALESAGIAATIEIVPVGDTSAPLMLLFQVMIAEGDAAAARIVLDGSRG